MHWTWQPSARISYGQGEDIEKWAETHNLSCLIVGEPTHRAGNTLDLAFTNISCTRAWVGQDECVTSDHLPISGKVTCGVWSKAAVRGPLWVSKDQLPYFARMVSQWFRGPGPL